jgi:hypothetical protein
MTALRKTCENLRPDKHRCAKTQANYFKKHDGMLVNIAMSVNGRYPRRYWSKLSAESS